MTLPKITIHESLKKILTEKVKFMLTEHDFNFEKIIELIQQGADVNVCDDEHSNTPLYWAAWYGEVEFAKQLVELGANVDVGNYDNTTPLIASIQKDMKVAPILIQAGANLDVRTSHLGDTALITACRLCSYEIISLLIGSGADISVKNDKGDTAFEVAQRVFNERPEARSERTLEVFKNEIHKHESRSSNERLAGIDNLFGLSR